MKGQPVAAIIRGSAYEEDLTGVIKSVIKLKEYFTELHIVYPIKYEMSDALLKELAPLQYFQHYDDITPSLISPKTLLMVDFNPDHTQVDENALVLLLESAQENRKRCDHYAVRGKVNLKEQNKQHPSLLVFVWLLAFIDSFRSILNVWGYHTHEDLRATKVTPHFAAHPHISEYGHAWFFSLFSNIASIRTHSSLISTPSDKSYVFRTVFNHPHTNLLSVLVFIVYYLSFALPWWNLLLPTPHLLSISEFSIQTSIYVPFYWYVHRNIYNPLWFSLWIIQIIVFMGVVSSRYKNANLMWVFLMPIYLTLSPLFFLVAKNKVLKL